MSTPLFPLISRPGGHSAKNAHQAGAPNTQQSGENPMVEPISADAPTVAMLQAHLRSTTARWLVTRPHMSVSFTALAELVAEILTTHTAALRTVNAELVDEIDGLEAERDQLKGMHASLLASQRAALWRLLKAQTRNAASLRSRLVYWRALEGAARADADRTDRQIRAALGAPAVDGSIVEWAQQLRDERDAFAAESERRESDIIELTVERDAAEARVAELLACEPVRTGEPR